MTMKKTMTKKKSRCHLWNDSDLEIFSLSLLRFQWSGRIEEVRYYCFMDVALSDFWKKRAVEVKVQYFFNNGQLPNFLLFSEVGSTWCVACKSSAIWWRSISHATPPSGDCTSFARKQYFNRRFDQNLENSFLFTKFFSSTYLVVPPVESACWKARRQTVLRSNASMATGRRWEFSLHLAFISRVITTSLVSSRVAVFLKTAHLGWRRGKIPIWHWPSSRTITTNIYRRLGRMSKI